jgi:hypothetical protein
VPPLSLHNLLAWLADTAPRAPNATGERLLPCGLIASPITGRDGNHEYLLLLQLLEPLSAVAPECAAVDEQAVERAIQEAFAANG